MPNKENSILSQSKQDKTCLRRLFTASLRLSGFWEAELAYLQSAVDPFLGHSEYMPPSHYHHQLTSSMV
jgi:hypothetical protein